MVSVRCLTLFKRLDRAEEYMLRIGNERQGGHQLVLARQSVTNRHIHAITSMSVRITVAAMTAVI